MQHQSWPFDSTIGIVEKNLNTGHKDTHFVNQWRYLGSIPHKKLTEPYSTLESVDHIDFDRDQYYILKRVLISDRPKNIEITFL